MSDEITIDSQIFISSKRASELSEYTQDYIGQLARGNQVHARRVGGLWYVSLDSLKKYKEESESYKPEVPAHEKSNYPDSLLSFDGKAYVSAGMAAKITGYNQDYVGQLARKSNILGRQIGNRWYIEREGILAHKQSKDALLGAVQAESVGIKRPETTDQGVYREKYSREEESFLNYTKDNGDLIPLLRLKDEAEEARGETGVNSVPIRILKSETQIRRASLSEISAITPGLRRIHSVRIPRNTINSLVLPVTAFTIVLVLSFGFVSLKNSSVYTKSNGFYGIQSTQLALAAESFFERGASLLEKLIVPEVTYQRKD